LSEGEAETIALISSPVKALDNTSSSIGPGNMRDKFPSDLGLLPHDKTLSTPYDKSSLFLEV
jgi:hypothetical protein